MIGMFRFPPLFRVLLLVLLTPVVFLLGCQSRLIYYPRHYSAETVDLFEQSGGQRIAFSTRQGAQTAFYQPPKNAVVPRTLWLCFAGNGSLALDWLFLTCNASPEDGFLLIDYPGYGECKGRPTPANIRESIRAAYVAWRARQPTDTATELGVLGHSLGAACALIAAEEWSVRRIILVSPFTSLVEMGNRTLFPPLGQLCLHRFDNLRTLRRLKPIQPWIRIFHGEEDGSIPSSMGRTLAEIQPDRSEFTEVGGAGHNDVLQIAGSSILQALQELSERPIHSF